MRVHRACLINPETVRPFSCSLPSVSSSSTHSPSGRRPADLPRAVYWAIKKSGKTTFAAMHVLTTLLVFGGRFAEGYCSPTTLSRRAAACSRRSGASSKLAVLAREANIIANNDHLPRDRRDHHGHRSDYAGPPAPIRPSACSTNCGVTPPSASAACGTRWSGRRRARSPAAS